MSNTSEALSNVRTMRELLRREESAARLGALVTWLRKAAYALPEDLAMPDHFVYNVERCAAIPEGALIVECERCHESVQVESVAEAADFRDVHYYCGQHVPAWRCPTCDNWAYDFEDDCRFCGREHDVLVPTAELPLEKLLDQYVAYDIYLPGRWWRATVRCNSLLRAKRAARAMYPRCEAEVRTAWGSWNAEGVI